MEEYLEFAIEIAKVAGKEMLDHYNVNEEYDYKEDKTVVTESDRFINHYLIEKVKEKYPTHSVMGEEESFLQDSNYVWVCDPIDGTGMFIERIPVAVFSLALVIDGTPKVGVVYDPFFDKMYTAIEGQGAYCNEERIHVNDKKLYEEGYRMNIEMWNKAEYDTLSMARDFLDKAALSQIGSVARSCMAVARGDFSCDIFPGTKHSNCDIAASCLIVKEAGGTVTNIYGEDQRYDQDIKGAIISNGVSHEEVLSVVKRYL